MVSTDPDEGFILTAPDDEPPLPIVIVGLPGRGELDAADEVRDGCMPAGSLPGGGMCSKTKLGVPAFAEGGAPPPGSWADGGGADPGGRIRGAELVRPLLGGGGGSGCASEAAG